MRYQPRKRKRILESSVCDPEVVLSACAGVATITLNRPAIHNAFDDKMIAALTRILKDIKSRDNINLVCLQSTGKSFCAGADLNWMKRMSTYTLEENLQDATRLSDVMHLLATLPQPTLAIVQGSAFGGGVGLAACCDLVIASEHAQFCLSEVKLGLAPAVISPYIVSAIGLRDAKRYMLTGEGISAHRAQELGLVHQITAHENLESARDEMITQLMNNGPQALKAVKQCCEDIVTITDKNNLREKLANTIAKLRVSDEAQEGMQAFFAKRKPKWNDHV